LLRAGVYNHGAHAWAKFIKGNGVDAEAGALVLPISGRLVRADIPVLCVRLRALLSMRDHLVGPVICDLGGLQQADLVTVAALARLQLTARRLGRRIELRQASPELCALLGLAGLAEVVPLERRETRRRRRQAEEREQPHGVEEEDHPADALT
jgi:ABC-type transporter Mla MlaB component